jgi:hypothetical protein
MTPEERILTSKLEAISQLLGYGKPKPVVKQRKKIQKELAKLSKKGDD